MPDRKLGGVSVDGFLLPVRQVEEDSGVGVDSLFKVLTAASFLLPLFTRQHATKVFADMVRKAASSKTTPSAVRQFVREAPKVERNLLEAASLGLATAPEFSGIGYEGFLFGHGKLGDSRAAFLYGRRPVIAIGSSANPFSIGHELAHFLTVPTRHRPVWAGPYVDPVLFGLEDPTTQLEMLTNLYATAGALGLRPLPNYARYLIDPREVLANAIAARVVPYRDELLTQFVAGSLLPRSYWPVADTMANFLKSGVRP